MNSFVKSPIYDEDLGRYRCIASNEFGHRSRDAVLSKQNETLEFFVFGFVDKKSDSFHQKTKLSLFKSKSLKYNRDLIVRIKPINKEFEMHKSVLLRCSSSNFTLN